MKMYKMIFFNSMITGTVIAVSAYSWMSMWMGLEINLLSIIPLFSNSKNIFSSESSLKYFITQAMASLILLMAVITMMLTTEFITPLMNFYLSMMLNSALLMKLGAAPFHFWLPEVIEGLSWMNSFIILTWQKIAPMMLLMNNKINVQFLMMIIISSLLVSTIMGFNQISMRKIMAFSSINHIAWMLSTLMMSMSTWTIYFLIYSLINLNIISMLWITKSFYINQISNILKMNKLTKLLFMSNFLSLGGLPPFIGFMPKWIIINWMTSNNMMLISLLMITTTLVMLFIYTRIMISSMVMNSTETKNHKNEIKSKWIMISNSVSTTSLILCTMLFNLM